MPGNFKFISIRDDWMVSLFSSNIVIKRRKNYDNEKIHRTKRTKLLVF